MMTAKIKFMVVVLSIAMVCIATISYAEDIQKCSLNGAEYVPQSEVVADTYDKNINDINLTLHFVLRIEANPDCHSQMRCIFLNFDAYDKNKKKVSTMQFGDVWSNGVSEQTFSTFYGQFKDRDDDELEEFKPETSFQPIGVNKDLTPASISETPYLLIFPHTYSELRYTSYQVPHYWDHYIRFYTKDRVYPDFRGKDFWVRKKCGTRK